MLALNANKFIGHTHNAPLLKYVDLGYNGLVLSQRRPGRHKLWLGQPGSELSKQGGN